MKTKYTISYEIEAFHTDHAAELVEQGHTPAIFTITDGENCEEVDTNSRGYIMQRLGDVNKRIYGMECGDDFCYSNGRIKPLLQERDELSRRLKSCNQSVSSP